MVLIAVCSSVVVDVDMDEPFAVWVELDRAGSAQALFLQSVLISPVADTSTTSQSEAVSSVTDRTEFGGYPIDLHL